MKATTGKPERVYPTNPRNGRRIGGPNPPPGQLTECQREIFNWTVNYTIEHFYQPSIREIAAHFGVNSPNSIWCHFRNLAKNGLIDLSGNSRTGRAPGSRSRAIVFHRRTPIGPGEAI
jgi:SOS-response transcriptional repressor LexA